MNKEYFRIAKGKYNEEGSIVILSGITGYSVERVQNKNGEFGRPMHVDEFTCMFEKAASKTKNFKITKLNDKKNKDRNVYLVNYKDKDEKANIVIRINEDVAKERPNLVTRYDNMCAANVTYRKTNNAQKRVKQAKGFAYNVAKGLVLVTASAGMLFGFAKGLEKADEIGRKQTEQFLEERRIQKQNEIDEKCTIEYNYNNDKDCLARKEGYASYEEQLKAEKEAQSLEENETRSKTR